MIDSEYENTKTKDTKDDTPSRVGKVMKEELFATWIATGLIIAVTGTQFSSRQEIKQSTRSILDVLSIGLALFIVLWASTSYSGFMNKLAHRIILVFCIIFLCSFLLYLGVLSMKGNI